MILIVPGPTGSGKSALGVRFAKALNGEIINADSVQLYKGCIIGAATMLPDEMEGIPHHCIGVISPRERFDVSRYRRLAEDTLKGIESRGKLPIFVGGTALYITSLLYGLAELPAADAQLRTELECCSSEELHERLRALDPESSEALHHADRVRLIRAIEGTLLSGRPISAVRREHGNRQLLHDAIVVTPVWERAVLYQRIEQRTRQMISAGLVKEVQALVDEYGEDAPALRSIGYEETIRCLRGQLSFVQLEDAISQNTRHFAKRQMTWLRNQPAKQGWRVRPSELDPAVVAGGDLSRFPKPGRIKQFSAWDVTREELIGELQMRLLAPQAGVDMWFVPGAKVV